MEQIIASYGFVKKATFKTRLQTIEGEVSQRFGTADYFGALEKVLGRRIRGQWGSRPTVIIERGQNYSFASAVLSSVFQKFFFSI